MRALRCAVWSRPLTSTTKRSRIRKYLAEIPTEL